MQSFSDDNIYNHMDYVQPHVHAIHEELIKQVYRLFPKEDEVLLLDGTSFYSHGIDRPPDLDELPDIEMSDEDARKAMSALDGQEVDGRNLKVNEAKPREDRGGGGRNRY